MDDPETQNNNANNPQESSVAEPQPQSAVPPTPEAQPQPIETPAPPEVVSEQTPSLRLVQPAAKPPRKIQPKYFFLGLAVVTLVLAAIGGGFFLLSSHSTGGNSPAPGSASQIDLLPTDTPVAASDQNTIESTPAENLTATTEPTITPSPKPSPSPSPSPTPTVTPTPSPVVITINSDPLDGFESNNGGGNDALDIRAGRNPSLVTRGFVSFSLSSIPSGHTVSHATLRLYQYKIDGAPYTAGGSLIVDHVSYQDSLSNSAYSASPLLSNIGTLTQNPTVEWKDLGVTDSVKDDLSNSRAHSQFRLRFATEATGGDTTGDFAYFESSENTGNTGNKPQLVVTYN